MPSKLFKASLILIVVGIAILAIIQVVYVPRVTAFRDDALNYTRNSTHTEPLPTLEEYGLDNNTMLLVTILGNAANVLVFIGAAYLVILLVARLVKRVRGFDVEKPVPEESNTTN